MPNEDSEFCIATTKAGSRCRNRPQAGSDYCHIHRKLAETSADTSAETSTEPIVSEPGVSEAEEATRDTKASRGPISRADLELLVNELNALAHELQRRLPESAPDTISPAQALGMFNTYVGRFAPASQREGLEALQSNLEDATFRDLADPDTWKGLWYIVVYSMQSQTASMKESVGNRLSILPGVGILTELTKNLQGASPKDFLDPETWKGMWYVFNYTAQLQLEEAKQKILNFGKEESTEE